MKRALTMLVAFTVAGCDGGVLVESHGTDATESSSGSGGGGSGGSGSTMNEVDLGWSAIGGVYPDVLPGEDYQLCQVFDGPFAEDARLDQMHGRYDLGVVGLSVYVVDAESGPGGPCPMFVGVLLNSQQESAVLIDIDQVMPVDRKIMFVLHVQNAGAEPLPVSAGASFHGWSKP